VTDLWSAFEALAGPSWRDPWSVPAPLRGPGPARPVRVALVVDPLGRGVSPQVRRGLLLAAEALEDADFAVEECEPPSIDVAARVLLDMLNTPDIRAGWLAYAPSMPEATQRFLSEFYRVAGDADPVRTTQAFTVRQGLLRAWSRFQETYPVILAPVCTDLPFAVGTDLDDVAGTIQNLRITLAVNALGLPAVALPVGLDDGLPLGVQLIGPRYREDVCLDAAAAVEARLGILTPIHPR
jgi:amidase